MLVNGPANVAGGEIRLEQVAEVERLGVAGRQIDEGEVVRQILVLAERVARGGEPVGEALDRVADRFRVLALGCCLCRADRRRRAAIDIGDKNGEPRDVAPALSLHGPR